MLRSIIAYSVGHKTIVFVGVIALVIAGVYATLHIPIDAVPDITNNQVQVITVSEGLPAEDVEKLVTFPVERLMSNLPEVIEVRSISRFGLSLVTVVFEERTPVLEARQLVGEQLSRAAAEIPDIFGSPEMMPITTGLGEIYQYTLEIEAGYENRYDPMELRTIQDWLVKRKLAGIEGIVETGSFGGLVKQYEVAYHAEKLAALNVTPTMLMEALERNNANASGGYFDERQKSIYLRTEGLVETLDEIAQIAVASNNGVPVIVSDVADVRYAPALRYGALTRDGKGETVGGISLLLKGANAKATVERVKERVEEVQNALPEGIRIVPYLDRSELVGRTIDTAVENLVAGGLVVALILIFFLGNLRAGLLVASIVPLSMLFALVMMYLTGVSANLMSLGAVDLGIVVDGAVIIVEGILHAMALGVLGKVLTKPEMDRLVIDNAVHIYKSAAFGVLIILVVFVPVLYLGGIEGKMFKPMALTLIFALLGALVLSMTYVPAASALLLRTIDLNKKTLGERWMHWMRDKYQRWLHGVLPKRVLTFGGLAVLMAFTIWRIAHMGAVFVPDLEEGDIAIQMAVPSGSSLDKVVATATEMEQILLAQFPEVKGVVSKIGTAEIPTDPMAIEDADVMVLMKPKSEWTSAQTREEISALMKEALEVLPEVEFEFTQPIQLRFNELISGSKADIAVKIFGPDPATLREVGEHAAEIITGIEGAADVKLERTEGLSQLIIKPNREKLAWHGVDLADVNLAIESNYAGAKAGVVYEDEKRFDLVMRRALKDDQPIDFSGILLKSNAGYLVPLSELVDIERDEGVAMVSRERAQRRISVGVNVRDRSLTETVEGIQSALQKALQMPPGYSISYEGEFRNYEEARDRLGIAVPTALIIILMLLYFTFPQWRHALFVFSAVPFTTIGGIWALTLRDLPFSISAGIGFIALFGVGVLNSIVLISHVNTVREAQPGLPLRDVVSQASADRFRPVLLTAITAILGFLPMALSTSVGAEVQRPLATVVIGGLFVDTFLTLVYLPKLYLWVEGRLIRKGSKGNSRKGGRNHTAIGTAVILVFTAGFTGHLSAQTSMSWEKFKAVAFEQNPHLDIADMALEMEKARSGENWLIEPTELEYGFGQLNNVPSENDYQWLFTQQFGSIPMHINRSKRQGARIGATEAEIVAFRTHFEADLKSGYLSWIIASERLQRANEYTMRLDSLQRMVALQAEAGAITRIEQSLFEAEVLRAHREKADLAVQLQQTRLELERLCQFDLGAVTPTEDEAFGLLHPVPDSLFTERYTKAQELKIQEQEYQLKMQRSAFFPALSVGYQRAKLEGVEGADAAFLGVSLPLWYGPDKSRTQRASIGLMQEKSRLDAVQFTVESEARQAFETYQTLKHLFDQNGTEMAQTANTLDNLARGAFASGETDVYQLRQSVTAAYQLYLEFLSLAESYGTARIELMRYEAP